MKWLDRFKPRASDKTSTSQSQSTTAPGIERRGDAPRAADWCASDASSVVRFGHKYGDLGTCDDVIIALTFSPDGRTIASGSSDRAVRLWDAQTGTERKVAECNESVSSLAFSSDGRYLAIGSFDKAIRVVDTTGTGTAVLGACGSAVMGLAFLPDGQSLIASSLSGELLRFAPGQSSPACLFGVKAPIHCIALSPDGQSVTFGTSASHSAYVSFDASGKAVFGNNAEQLDESVRLVSTENGEIKWQRKVGSAVYATAFSKDGKTVAIGTADGDVYEMEASSGRPTLMGNLSDEWIRDSDSQNAVIYRKLIKAGQGAKANIMLPDRAVSAVGFTSHGNHIISAGRDGSLRVWTRGKTESALVFRGSEALLCLAIAHNTTSVAAAGRDRVVRNFDWQDALVQRALR